MDYNLPGSSVHGISYTGILEWLPFPSPGNLPDPGIKSASPALAGKFFTTETPGKPYFAACITTITYGALGWNWRSQCPPLLCGKSTPDFG